MPIEEKGQREKGKHPAQSMADVAVDQIAADFLRLSGTDDRRYFYAPHACIIRQTSPCKNSSSRGRIAILKRNAHGIGGQNHTPRRNTLIRVTSLLYWGARSCAKAGVRGELKKESYCYQAHFTASGFALRKRAASTSLAF